MSIKTILKDSKKVIYILYTFNLKLLTISSRVRGGSRDFEKGALYVGHHGSSMKKILSLRWFEKAKITLETINFWRNISISIFKFSPIFICNESLPMKSYQFFKIYKQMVRKEKKHSYSS